MRVLRLLLLLVLLLLLSLHVSWLQEDTMGTSGMAAVRQLSAETS